jgi:uncharacterized protein
LLSPAERTRLENRLAEAERATGVQMVIAVFRSLEGENLEDYSIRLAERWRIGQRGLDTGAILLVFVNDRKVRLEVGYGLEPVVPDAVASRIVREAVAPRFREGRYADGLAAAVEAVLERVGPGRGPPATGRSAARPSTWSLAMLVLFAIVALLLLREAWSGRRFVQGGDRMSRGGWSVPPVAYPWWRSGGGGGFGGGGGSDLGGGGGFSGGGGSFGGGGASGDW